MINMIKMDLFRLFKTRSMYVILIIMMSLLFWTEYMTKTELDEIKNEQVTDVEGVSSEDKTEDEVLNIGIEVGTPEIGEKYTVYDSFWSDTSGGVMALFVVIFAVLFSTADLNSGYIKNIGGQVNHRGLLIVSRAVALFVFNVLVLSLSLVALAVGDRVFFGYLEWGNVKKLLIYLALQILMHFALSLICMGIAVLIRNNVISMIIAVCLCMNLTTIIYSMIDKLIHKMGYETFALVTHLVTGRIQLLSMNVTQKECITSISVSVVFILIMLVSGSIIFEKRDVA